MKKMKFTLVIALLTILTVGAQAQMSFVLSPEMGIQSSKLKATGDLDYSGDFPAQDVNYSGIFSYNGGVTFGVQFSGHWSLLSGVKYNRKGGKVIIETRDPSAPFEWENSDGTIARDLGEIKETHTHNWLSIPILAGAQFGNNIKLGLNIGPQFNLSIGEYNTTNEFGLENNNIPTQETNEKPGTSTSSLYKKSHMSLLVLPYVSYQVNRQGSIRLSVMIESGSDMVNENYVVADGNGGARNVSGTIKNNQFGVSLSYVHTFDLKVGVKY